MSNEALRKCPQCGTPIKEEAPAGLCPKCLMVLNLKTETVFTGDPGVPPVPLPPEEIAPYFPQLEILACLGRGGMGVVYKARQKSLNRLVALKLLAPERVTDARFAERFTTEAHALAALNHPHIVTVYDFGQAGGYYFLLMEFVDGVNLRQLLEARKLKPEEALAIVPPLCEALQYAHEHGIVHRDIKPANLLIDKAGRVKIADFGIAKMVGENSSVGVAESQPAGTPQYMAPEQRDHQATDHRADIYSLGVVLYEMLTGELPGTKLQAPSRKVQIDVRLDEIVLRALEKMPELRFQTAAEMRTQVETIAHTAPKANAEAAKPEAAPLSLPASVGTRPRFIKIGTSFLISLEQMAAWGGPFSILRSRGQLVLDDRQLTHSCGATITVIPLAAIRDLSIGEYPRAMHPLPVDILSISYEEGGRRRQVLLSPMEGWIGSPSIWNARVAEWHFAIREAVFAATGHEPSTTPAEQLGIPSAVKGMAFTMLFPLGMLLFLVPVLIMSDPHGGSIFSLLGPVAAGLGVTLVVLILLFLLGGFLGKNRRRTFPRGKTFVGLMVGMAMLAFGAFWIVERQKASNPDSARIEWAPEGAIGNLAVVNISTLVQRNGLELRVTYSGPQLPANVEQQLPEFQEASLVTLLRPGMHPQLIRPQVNQNELIGFIMPDADLALEVLHHLQGKGGVRLGPGGVARWEIFSVTDSHGAKYSSEIEVLNPDGAGSVLEQAPASRVFPLRYRLGSDMAEELRQITLGRPGYEAKPSADNQEILVVAPPEALMRAQTFVTVHDWPDKITRGSNYQYFDDTVTHAARSFFYACAIEDDVEAISKQLSAGVLAELKGDTKSKKFLDYQMGGVADKGWEAALRADWPGKKQAIERLVREWNRYPLKRLTEDPGVAIGFGVKYFCSVSFEGAPKPFYQVTIEPKRGEAPGDGRTVYYFSSLPPWWNSEPDEPPADAKRRWKMGRQTEDGARF